MQAASVESAPQVAPPSSERRTVSISRRSDDGLQKKRMALDCDSSLDARPERPVPEPRDAIAARGAASVEPWHPCGSGSMSVGSCLTPFHDLPSSFDTCTTRRKRSGWRWARCVLRLTVRPPA